MPLEVSVYTCASQIIIGSSLRHHVSLPEETESVRRMQVSTYKYVLEFWGYTFSYYLMTWRCCPFVSVIPIDPFIWLLHAPGTEYKGTHSNHI